MLVHYYGNGGVDWAHNNWYATRNLNGGKWRFHARDQEHPFPTHDNSDGVDQTTNYTTKRDLDAPTMILRDLLGDNATGAGAASSNPSIGNLEFRVKFADHVQELLYNGGLLTPTAA